MSNVLGIVWPTVGTTQPGTAGDNWGPLLTRSLDALADEVYSPANKITPAGITINTDVSFSGSSAVRLHSIQLLNNTATLAATGTVYIADGDLYYTDLNGNATLMASSGSGAIPFGVESIAALRLLEGTADQVVTLLGFYGNGDGGGGQFYWDSTSLETDNGGTIIKATAVTTGRWKRIYSGAWNIKWFGAKDDWNGTTGTNNKTILNNMFNFLPTYGGTVYVPTAGTGAYYISASNNQGLLVQSKQKFTFFGDGPGSRFQMERDCRFMDFYFGTGSIFRDFSVVGTLQRDGADAGDSGNPIFSNTSQGPLLLGYNLDTDVHNCRWENVGGYGVFVFVANTNTRIHNNDFILTQAGVQTGGYTEASFTPNFDLSICDNYFLGNTWVTASAHHLSGSDDMIAVFTAAGRVEICRNFIDKQGPTLTNQARAIDFEGINGGRLSSLVVHDNMIANVRTWNKGNARAAIDIYAEDIHGMQNVSIKDNTIINSNEAIVIYGPWHNANLSICDNVISGVAYLSQSADGPAAGIYLNANVGTSGDVGTVQINSNLIDAADDYGIYLTYPVTNVTMQGNIVTRAGFYTTGSGRIGQGIAITGFQENVSMIGNMVSGSVGSGIVPSQVQRLTMIGNQSNGNGEYGLWLQGSSLFTGSFIGNTYYKNASGSFHEDVTQPTHYTYIGNTEAPGTRGISTTDTPAQNLRGQTFITGTMTAVDVTLPIPEIDGTYFIVATAVSSSGGTLTSGSMVVTNISSSNTKFRLTTLDCPGSAKAVYFNWMLVR